MHASQVSSHRSIFDDLNVRFYVSDHNGYDENYHRIFKPWHGAIVALIDLHSRHVRCSGTVQELANRLHVDLIPKFHELKEKVEEFHALINELYVSARDLYNLARAKYFKRDNCQGRWHYPGFLTYHRFRRTLFRHGRDSLVVVMKFVHFGPNFTKWASQ